MRIILLLLLGMSAPLYGGDVYSYVDPDGVKIFSNLGGQRTGKAVGEELLETVTEAGGNFLPLIEKVASNYGVDGDLVRSIIQVESAFNPRAISPKDCKGLMQLHPDTARRFDVQDVFDPAQNIEGGVKYLTYLIDLFDRDLDLVLAAYNAGENAVARYNGIPPYKETQSYVRKVRNLFQGTLETDGTRDQRRNRKIYRVVQPDGQILFTNVPSSS